MTVVSRRRARAADAGASRSRYGSRRALLLRRAQRPALPPALGPLRQRRGRTAPLPPVHRHRPRRAGRTHPGRGTSRCPTPPSWPRRLLAASSMNGAMIDSIFNVFFKLRITHSYESVLATPLDTGDVALGELVWSVARGVVLRRHLPRHHGRSWATPRAGWWSSASGRAACCSAPRSPRWGWPPPPTCEAGRTSTSSPCSSSRSSSSRAPSIR